MPEVAAAALVLLGVLAAALGVLTLGAVLDALAVGAPAAPAVLSPLSEAARLLLRRPASPARLGESGAPLVVAVLLAEAALLDAPGGVIWVVGLAAVAAALIARRRSPSAIASSALPLAVAVASPAVAAGGVGFADVAAAQRDLWFAVQMPVAVLVLLLVLAASGLRAADPAPSLGRAALQVSGAVVVAALFLGPADPVRRLVAAGVILLVLIGIARAIPDVPIARPARRLLLPLALVQLAVVLAVRLTA